MRALTPLILAAGLMAGILQPPRATAASRQPPSKFVESDSLRWPPGTEIVRFENLEGIVLVPATLRGRLEADTTGPLALDTGAGYLALDMGLARILGLADSTGEAQAVNLASRPLPRMSLGAWKIDQVEPVLTVDGEIVRRVSDRPVLGLLGQKPLGDRVVWIDYREEVLALIPAAPPAEAGELPAGERDRDLGPERAARDSAPARTRAEVAEGAAGARTRALRADDAAEARSRTLLAGLLTPRAVAVRFLLVGDGKMLLHGVVSDPSPPRYSRRLNLLVDTGATKCVLFEDTLEPMVRHAAAWPALRGLSAPTLIGTADARIARIPSIEIDAARGRLRARGVDVGVIRSELSQVLARVTQTTIHGLIGYSFLKRFRVAVDYPNRVLWLDPIPGYRDDRPLEYCHVGLQLERQEDAVVVMGVVEGSPAARAGITRGDEVVALDGATVREVDLIALTRRMEGEPGRSLTLVIRRDGVDRTVRLIRRRLL